MAQVAALGSPQFLVAGLSAGLVGSVATISQLSDLGYASLALLASFGLVAAVSLILVRHFATFLSRMPAAIACRLDAATQAIDRISSQPGLITKLTFLYVIAVLFRAVRLFVLFEVLQSELDFLVVLLLTAIGEIALLFQITPGGLGVREGTLLAAGTLLGIDMDLVATVAVLDRVLTMITVSLGAPLAFWALARPRGCFSQP